MDGVDAGLVAGLAVGLALAACCAGSSREGTGEGSHADDGALVQELPNRAVRCSEGAHRTVDIK